MTSNDVIFQTADDELINLQSKQQAVAAPAAEEDVEVRRRTYDSLCSNENSFLSVEISIG